MRTTLEVLGIDRMSIPERLALAKEIWASVMGERISSPSVEVLPEAEEPLPKRRVTPEEAKEWMRTFVPRDDWERRLLTIGTDCGVSLSNEALSSEGLYD